MCNTFVQKPHSLSAHYYLCKEKNRVKLISHTQYKSFETLYFRTTIYSSNNNNNNNELYILHNAALCVVFVIHIKMNEHFWCTSQRNHHNI